LEVDICCKLEPKALPESHACVLCRHSGQPQLFWFTSLRACGLLPGPLPLQALHGRLFPAATKDQTLPRVLALMPGTRLVTTTIREYRCALHPERLYHQGCVALFTACTGSPPFNPQLPGLPVRQQPLTFSLETLPLSRDGLMQLARLAMRLGRVALMPEPDCMTEWVRTFGLYSPRGFLLRSLRSTLLDSGFAIRSGSCAALL
jgi:hypothetical protein